MKTSSTVSNLSGKASHRIKEEIYNTFEINKKDQALYQATSDRHRERQTERLGTPLFQKTSIINEREKNFKPQIQKTVYSDQQSLIFDHTEARALKEIQFKSTSQRVLEPGQNSDQVYKRQLKTSEYSTQLNSQRNPITYGDPKSEYTRNLKVKRENMPKDQFSFQ